MKTNPLLKILLEVFELGRQHYAKRGHAPHIYDWMEENESRIIALGKLGPLAKNKDSESDFECPKDKSICRMYGTYYCNRLCDLT